ncbi:hypothetical protein LguiA_014953 [Lonicera macranthoides]
MKIIHRVSIFTILFFLCTIHLARGRSIKGETNLESDGLELDPKIEMVNYVEASTVTCKPVYGFLPCTTDIWGQLFMIVIYQYLLSLGGSYVSAGSDLFFQLTGPGIFGASLFHLLPTFPQLSLIIVSGLSSSSESAATQAAMGMAVNAGSAVMLLTLIWGSCIVFGSFDLSTPSPISSTTALVDDDTQTPPKSVSGLGVRTDEQTSDTARIMFLSLVPLLILQLAKIINSSSGVRVVVLIALIVTLVLLFAYSIYQVFSPWIQNRRFEYMTQKFVKDRLLSLLSQNGRPNVALIREIFNEIDKNKDGTVSIVELRVLILGIKLQEGGTLREDYIKNVMDAMDISGDDSINQDEFVRVISKWLTEAKKSITTKSRGFFSSLTDAEEEQQKLITQTKQSASADSSWRDYLTAALQVFGGTAILAVLAMPLIETVADFSTSANIPSFLVPYVVIPLAMNYGRALGVISSAQQKTEDAISLTLSELYGSVFTSNLFGLTIFLSLVYIRNLEWDVSAEVLVVFIICTAMGLFTSFRTVFPRWTGFVAYLLYPISLVFLYVLTSVFGWS